MAGDWLKVEKDTPEKPEVLALATLLGITPEEAFARCFRVWRWADSQTTNGHARVTLLSSLDGIAGLSGFADALVKVGWLHVRSGALEFPNFGRHMGQSAKNRALATARKQAQRSRSCHVSVTPDCGPEKRREEKSIKTPPTRAPRGGEEVPIPPELDTPEFRSSWSEWLAYRCEARLKRYTSRGTKALFSKWSAVGPSRAAAAIRYSMAQGYQGIVEEPARPGGNGRAPADLFAGQREFLRRHGHGDASGSDGLDRLSFGGGGQADDGRPG